MKYLILLFLFTGCSAFQKKPRLQIPVKERLSIEYGPTTRGDGSFVDKSVDYGLNEVVATHLYVVDLNNDGYTDLVVLPEFYSQPEFYYFNPETSQFEQYYYAPFTAPIKASFLVFADFDHDDVLDVIVGTLNQKTEMTKESVKYFKGSLIKDKLWFSEKNLIQSDPSPTSSVSVVDVDLDGKLDLYFANWFNDVKDVPTPTPDRLYMWEKERWIDRSTRLDGELIQNETKESYINAAPTYGSATCDLNGDGFPEILTAMTNGYSNKLWLNQYQLSGNLRNFSDIGPSSRYAKDAEGFHVPRGGGRTFFSACADYNNDGLMDIYLGELSHSYDAESVDKSSILTGIKKDEILFLRTEYLADSQNINWNRGDKRAIWFDYNNDGRMDLLVMNSGFPPHSRLVLFEQEENHDFIDVAKNKGLDILNPQGTVIIDVNRDGQMDILTSQSNIRDADIKRRIYLFVNNNQKNEDRSLRLFPRGIEANSLALGAMVLLEVKNGSKIETRRQWVEYSQGGLPSQNEEGLLFGLKKAEEVVRVKVRWPIALNKKSIGRSYREVSYRLDKSNNSSNQSITLCEDGRIFYKRRFCR
jgi:enediyne biosynthesis protein E4